MIGECFLILVQEPGLSSALWQVEESEYGKENGESSLNNKEPSPGVVN